MIVTFTAGCPACGEDAVWTQRGDVVAEAAFSINCGCAEVAA